MTVFVCPVRVYYEDTDSGGVVYYANYLRFMERARTEWLRSFGVEQDELVRSEGVIFAVRSVQIEYLRPARFNDLLYVSVAVVQHGRASLTVAQDIVQATGGAESAHTPFNIDGNDFAALKERVLCTGQVRIACIDATALRPRPIPGHVFKKVFVEIHGDA